MDAVYLVVGEDGYLKANALKNIKDKVLGHSKQQELNYKVFYSDSTKASEVTNYVRSLGFLGDRQLILLRDFERFLPSEKKIILNYSKNPNKSAVLILELTDKSNLKKNIYKDLLDYCRPIDCSPPPLSSVSRWITKFASSRKKRISKEAIQLLVVNLGRKLDALDEAMEKLSLYIDQRRDITSKDVEVLIGFDIDYSAYNLTDAIGRKDSQDALRIIRRLMTNKNEAIKLLGSIIRHFEKIHKAKELLKSGESNRNVGAYLNIPTFLVERFIYQVNDFNSQAIKEAFKYMLDADLTLKTKKIKIGVIFESLVFKLCSLK